MVKEIKTPPAAAADPAGESIARAVPEEPIRLVAIDLDGTLLTSVKQVSEQTVRGLACAREAGVKIVIASARPPRSVRHIYKLLELDTPQINYNGALIWDERRQAAIYHRPLAAELARAIVEMARDQYPEVLVTCELMDKWLTDRDDNTHTTETGKMFKPDVIAPLDTFLDKPVTKLMLLSKPAIIARLEAMLVDRFGQDVAMVRTDDDLIQIMDKRVGKAAALRKLAGAYGIRTREIMALGDAPNDVGMLQLAGVAVAMDNAAPVVKKVAHWVAPSNDDHGVHAALRRYGLCD